MKSNNPVAASAETSSGRPCTWSSNSDEGFPGRAPDNARDSARKSAVCVCEVIRANFVHTVCMQRTASHAPSPVCPAHGRKARAAWRRIVLDRADQCKQRLGGRMMLDVGRHDPLPSALGSAASARAGMKLGRQYEGWDAVDRRTGLQRGAAPARAPRSPRRGSRRGRSCRLELGASRGDRRRRRLRRRDPDDPRDVRSPPGAAALHPTSGSSGQGRGRESGRSGSGRRSRPHDRRRSLHAARGGRRAIRGARPRYRLRNGFTLPPRLRRRRAPAGTPRARRKDVQPALPPGDRTRLAGHAVRLQALPAKHDARAVRAAARRRLRLRRRALRQRRSARASSLGSAGALDQQRGHPGDALRFVGADGAGPRPNRLESATAQTSVRWTKRSNERLWARLQLGGSMR